MQICFCFCKACICLKILENVQISVRMIDGLDITNEYSVKCDFILNTDIFIDAALNTLLRNFWKCNVLWFYLFGQGVPNETKGMINLKWTYINISGKGHSLTFLKDHSVSTFSNIFFSETTGPVEAKVHMEFPWDGWTKVCSNGLGHMTKMAAMPIYGKNLLLWNRKADDLETWYAASSTQVLPSLFKWCPWVDLDLFYGKVKFGPLCFCMEKKKKNGFFMI